MKNINRIRAKKYKHQKVRTYKKLRETGCLRAGRGQARGSGRVHRGLRLVRDAGDRGRQSAGYR